MGKRGGSHGLEIWALETKILLAVLFLREGVTWPPQWSVFLSVKQGSFVGREVSSSSAGRGP